MRRLVMPEQILQVSLQLFADTPSNFLMRDDMKMFYAWNDIQVVICTCYADTADGCPLHQCRMGPQVFLPCRSWLIVLSSSVFSLCGCELVARGGMVT